MRERYRRAAVVGPLARHVAPGVPASPPQPVHEEATIILLSLTQ
jgi:hypothetical protein